MLKYIIDRFKRAKEGDRLSQVNIESAIDIIGKNGMKAHFYFAGIGNREDKELSYALDTLEAAGFLITDSDGSLVGKVATRRPSSDELASRRRAEFKIVE